MTLIDYGLRIQRGEVVDPSFILRCTPRRKTPTRGSSYLEDGQSGAWRFQITQGCERLALQAQRIPSAAMSFRNLILNQRCDTTSPFVNAIAWKACGGEVDIASLKGRKCYAGLTSAQRAT